MALLFSTPDLSDARVRAFERSFGGVGLVLIERRPATDCSMGDCYRNVARKVERAGGAIRYGWMIIELDGLALIAWHHAVWCSAGKLLDISVHPLTGTAISETLFSIDPKQDYRTGWPLGKPLIIEPLIASEIVERYACAETALHSLRTRYFQEQIALGSAWYSTFDETISVDNYADEVALRALEETWQPRIAAAIVVRDMWLEQLGDLQSNLG